MSSVIYQNDRLNVLINISENWDGQIFFGIFTAILKIPKFQNGNHYNSKNKNFTETCLTNFQQYFFRAIFLVCLHIYIKPIFWLSRPILFKNVKKSIFQTFSDFQVEYAKMTGSMSRSRKWYHT